MHTDFRIMVPSDKMDRARGREREEKEGRKGQLGFAITVLGLFL